MTGGERKGIACGGHWVVDRNKVIDHYPPENSIATILDEAMGGGGAAYNVIVDLAKFDPGLPLTAAGVIGDDADGDYIIHDCRQYPNISLRFLKRTSLARTAYTDAYSVPSTGSRTFFSSKGSNRFFDVDTVNVSSLDVWLFHLGYLTLLESLDKEDSEYGRVSARFLSRIKERGIRTSLDLVSTFRPDYASVVAPALEFVDVLTMNDFEAEQLSGLEVRREGRPNLEDLRQISRRLFDMGRTELIVIHFPEGAFAAMRSGDEIVQPSLNVPPRQILGSAGAGDAFCAGVLYGLYRGFAFEDVIEFATCAGAMSLFHVTTTGALGHWTEVWKMRDQYSFREIHACFDG